MRTTSLLFALVALFASACVDTTGDAPPDAGQSDEPDAHVLEIDAPSPDAAIALQDATPAHDAVQPDAESPDSTPALVDADLGHPLLCSNECPVEFECADYSCSCIATPDKPCLGKCAIACGDAGWIQDEPSGMWYCDTPETRYAHACHGPDGPL